MKRDKRSVAKMGAKYSYRLFRPMLVAPEAFERIERGYLAHALRSRPMLMTPHIAERAASLLEGTSPKLSDRRAARIAQERWMAMTYALETRGGVKAAAVVKALARDWKVSEAVVEASRDKWLEAARAAIQNYVDGGVAESDAVQMLRERAERSRETVLKIRTSLAASEPRRVKKK